MPVIKWAQRKKRFSHSIIVCRSRYFSRARLARVLTQEDALCLMESSSSGRLSRMDAKFMKRAIDLSRTNMQKLAGGPFGAVIVKDGKIIGEGWNQVTSTND